MKYIFLISFCLISCTVDSEKESKLQVTQYHKDNIEEVMELNADSVRDGYTYVYSDGVLHRKMAYINGLLHGEDSLYYSSENPQKVTQWKKGVPIYDEIEFYDEDFAVVVEVDGKDTIIMAPKFKKYSFFNSDNKISFSGYYDRNGEFTKIYGTSIANSYVDERPAIAGKPYSINYKIALPPLTQADFSIEVQKDNRIIESVKGNVDRYFNTVTHKFIPRNKGKYRVLAIYEMSNLSEILSMLILSK